MFRKGDTKLMVVTLLILNGIFTTFFAIRFSSQFTAKYLLKIRPHFICVPACERSMSENERQSQTYAVISLMINYMVQ